MCRKVSCSYARWSERGPCRCSGLPGRSLQLAALEVVAVALLAICNAVKHMRWDPGPLEALTVIPCRKIRPCLSEAEICSDPEEMDFSVTP